jgi:hypothetical protein
MTGARSFFVTFIMAFGTLLLMPTAYNSLNMRSQTCHFITI